MAMIESAEDFDRLILDYLKYKSDNLEPEEILERINAGDWELNCPDLIGYGRDRIPPELLESSDGGMWRGKCMSYSKEEKIECGFTDTKGMDTCEKCWALSYHILKTRIDKYFYFWRLENEQN